MSRIGKQPITIPASVTVDIQPQTITVDGPKGSLTQSRLAGIEVECRHNQCLVNRRDDTKTSRAQHGLMRSLINNMVIGVTAGFTKQLEVIGIGYKVQLEGQTLILNLGFSHEVRYPVADKIDIEIDGNNIKIAGIDKQQVGQIAATIRSLKKPEPYKGKGIRYLGEVVRRKSGKGSKEA